MLAAHVRCFCEQNNVKLFISLSLVQMAHKLLLKFKPKLILFFSLHFSLFTGMLIHATNMTHCTTSEPNWKWANINWRGANTKNTHSPTTRHVFFRANMNMRSSCNWLNSFQLETRTTLNNNNNNKKKNNNRNNNRATNCSKNEFRIFGI